MKGFFLVLTASGPWGDASPEIQASKWSGGTLECPPPNSDSCKAVFL